MNKEEFIGKMQLAYFGDRNALEECTQEYLKTKELYNKAITDSVRESKRRMNLKKALEKIEKYIKSESPDAGVSGKKILNIINEVKEVRSSERKNKLS